MLSLIWYKLDPGFLAPIWLLAGLVALIAMILLEIGSFRRRRQALRMFAASHLIPLLAASVSPLKRLLKAIFLTSGMALVFVALARPHLLDDWQDENRTGLDILLAVDCSKSMLTEDVKPNRIERAKLAIADFADRLPDNRLGLIAFAGDAFLQCPLTLDHDAFQSAARELDTDTIPRPGTDIATAIDEAVDALKSQPANLKFLILVTDGEDLEGRVLNSAKNAAQSGLRIYTVGVGTPEGGVIPERDEYGTVTNHHDADGQEVVSKLDENTLRQIAEITDGAYVPLGQRGEGLDEIYDRYIAPIPKQNIEERRQKIPVERFEWPLAVAILFLMWEFIVNDRVSPAKKGPPSTRTAPSRRAARSRALASETTVTMQLLACAFLLCGARGTACAEATATAETEYKAGHFEDAMDDYGKALESDPDRSDLEYDRGDAAYKAGEYSEAELAFRKALETPDLDLQERTYFNLGNAQFQHGAALQRVDSRKTVRLWKQALRAYDSALKLRQTADAQHNYKYVKEKLEELLEQMKASGQGEPSDGSGSSGDDGSDGSSSPGDPSQQDGSSGQLQNSNDGQNQAGSSHGNGKGNSSQNGKNQQARAYSGTRSRDLEDPEIKSREEAEDLLDSLKDEEHHVTARQLSNEAPPPTTSGKDW